MGQISRLSGELYSSLPDAGCSQDVAKRCADAAKNGEKGLLMKELADHRKALLDDLHESQRKIDCIDYIIYKVNKLNDIKGDNDNEQRKA